MTAPGNPTDVMQVITVVAQVISVHRWQEQVLAGMAWVYESYAQEHKHLYPLQDAAKKVRRGLWRDPRPIPPWEWRKGVR